jgi:uncharacterized membrane protein
MTPSVRAVTAATLATGAAMLVLDLTWLGIVARDLYSVALGPLKRPEVFWPAAALFYLFYVAVTVAYAVLPADSPGSAARRGAALGLVVYAAYELTNWAVLNDWPAWIVPIDVVWGVVLTSVASAAGRAAGRRLEGATP